MTEPYRDPLIPQTGEDRNGESALSAEDRTDADSDAHHALARRSKFVGEHGPEILVQPSTRINVQRQSRRIE